MNKFNNKKLSNLLKLALDNKTQKEFAKELGISHEYLNRTINMKYTNPPSRDLLKKISENSNVSEKDLLKACGYLNDKEGLDLKEEDLLFELINIIKDNTSNIKNNLTVFERVEDLIERLLYNFYFDLKYDIIDIVEKKYLIKVELKTNNKCLKLYVALSTLCLENDDLILKDVYIKKSKIDSMFNVNKGIHNNNPNYYYKFVDKNKVINHTNLKTEYYIETITGFGFRVKDIVRNKNTSQFSMRELAQQMSDETGILIEYIEDDFSKENNAILYVSKKEPNKVVKEIFNTYKAKLNIKTCGFCYVYKQRKAPY